MERKGIISAGNWLVDRVKIIDHYPSKGNLISIDRVETGLGGCSHNVLVDLAKLQSGIPLYAGGCIGNDGDGQYVLDTIRSNGIDAANMHILDDVATSYTDVMSESSGDNTRTFFHFRGANARLSAAYISQMHTPERIFHLGYLLLLDELDKDDPEYGVVAARVLDMLQKEGYRTSVDLVSEESDRFRHIVVPCLPYIDYLIINEVEAGATIGANLRDNNGKLDRASLEETAAWLLSKGVKQLCVIHFPEGGYAVSPQGASCWSSSIPVEKGGIVSAVGAGDAFCAGMLYAVHEGLSLEEALRIANTSARFNLYSPTSTGGAPSMEKILEFITKNY